jgi:hypothetical protein
VQIGSLGKESSVAKRNAISSGVSRTRFNGRADSKACRIACGILAAVVALVSGVRDLRAAENSAPTETEVKAAMIYNFAQFIEWPESEQKTGPPSFVIGVFGEDPIEMILQETLKGETFQNRSIQVRHLMAPNDAKACDIVFVSQSQRKRVPEILEAIRGSNTLTVGDTEDFVAVGGMIAFKKEGNRVRFQINPDAAMRAGLRISSKLLRLAIVQGDTAMKGGA